MVGGVDHRAGPDDGAVADDQSPEPVHEAPVVEGDPVTKLDLVAVQPHDLVEVVAALPNPLGVAGPQRYGPLGALRDDHVALSDPASTAAP